MHTQMLHKYYLKEGYRVNKRAPRHSYSLDGRMSRKKNYNFVEHVARRAHIDQLIFIGSGDIGLMRDLTGLFQVTIIERKSSSIHLEQELPHATVLAYDLERGLPRLAPDLWEQSIVIVFDTLQNLRQPGNILKDLARVAQKAPYLFISALDRVVARGPEDFGPPQNTTHIREWSMDELFALLKSYKIDCLIGHTLGKEGGQTKDTILAIAGRHVIPRASPKTAPPKILAIMTAYNEEDVITHTVQHLLKEGVDVHVVDNWSTDTTFSQIKELAAHHDNLSYERFPRAKPKEHKYEWERLLKRVEDIAEASPHDWIIHNDADEFRYAPWKDLSLKEAISIIDEWGYNAVDFTVKDFRPTKDGYDGSVSPVEYFLYFDAFGHSSYVEQIKGWKNVGRVDLATSGGHHATIANQKTFPLKFLSRHYPLRSKFQASKKIFKERKPGFMATERKRGWHAQYDTYKETDSFIWDKNYLVEFREETFFHEFFMERLSGIGTDEDS